MALANLTNTATRNGIATIVSCKFRIEVDYGQGYKPFVLNGNNDHQLDALGVFLSSQVEMVVVPHTLGGDFVAKFSCVDRNTVKYIKNTGEPVYFRIS
jgi:hypothetical protein